MRNGTWSVTVSGMGVPRVIRPPHVPSQHLAREAAEAVHAQPDVQAIGADVHPLDQQSHDAGLLGGEKFVPQRVELLKRCAGVGLGEVVGMGAGGLPRPCHELGLAEHGAQLVDDGGFDLTCGHAAHRT